MNDQNNVIDPFTATVEARDEQIKEEKEKEEFSGYEEYEVLGLEDDKDKVFRIVGLPPGFRENPTDTKFLLQSKIMKDDKKGYFICNWKYYLDDNKRPVLDEDWFLTKWYKEVTESKWVDYPDGKTDENGKKGRYMPIHADSEVQKTVSLNISDHINNKFPPNFFPKVRFLANVIDRHDDWCKENKHTKFLSSKKTVKYYDNVNEQGEKTGEQTKVVFKDNGVPISVFNKIVENVLAHQGQKNWNKVDIVIKKIAKDKDYSVRDMTEHKISEEAKRIGSTEPLTEEELAYEKYDLDKNNDTTSYEKIKKNIGKLIQKWDIEQGTRWFEQLQILVDEEKANASTDVEEIQDAINQTVEKEYNEDIKDKITEPETETKVSVEQQKETQESLKEEISESPKRRRVASKPDSKPSQKLTEEDFIKFFPAWDKLSEDDKKLMMDCVICFENNIPQYDSTKDEPLPCPEDNCYYPNTEINVKFPELVSVCPNCGVKVELI